MVRIFFVAVQAHFDLVCMFFSIVIIWQSVLVLLNRSKFEVLTFQMTSKNEMLDETKSKPIQRENFVGWVWKYWMKICSQSDFHPTQFSFIEHDIFFFCYFCVLLNRPSISSNMTFLLCWMKCWIGLARPLENSSAFTGKKSVSKFLFK